MFIWELVLTSRIMLAGGLIYQVVEVFLIFEKIA